MFESNMTWKCTGASQGTDENSQKYWRQNLETGHTWKTEGQCWATAEEIHLEGGEHFVLVKTESSEGLVGKAR